FADLVKLSPVNRIPVDLKEMVLGVVNLFKMKGEEQGVLFNLNLPHTYFLVNADALQLEQVLINIVKNAMESIDSKGIIHVTIDPKARQLQIEDSGKGIFAEHVEKLFSPFFSTKKDGQGIGLTLVREILLNHGYTFSLKTLKPGKTVFTINL
ncbi:MAG: GHKL domain-containing protein, partial [Pedobacter sp.]